MENRNMPRFCINKNSQPTGEHEVHNLDANCGHLPNTENQINLGIFSSCHGAISKARQEYPNANIDGCAYCCPACHTK